MDEYISMTAKEVTLSIEQFNDIQNKIIQLEAKNKKLELEVKGLLGQSDSSDQ